MTTQQIKDQLRQPFTPEAWHNDLLPYVFGREQVSRFPVPVDLEVEETYRDRVAAKRQLGVVQLGGENLFGEATRLAIVEVELQPGAINIARNRVGLRGLTFGLIDGEQASGVLAFYHDPSQPNSYRFSFLTRQSDFDEATGDIIITATHPKRYTYVLGKQEACTTAAKRLQVLAQAKPTATLKLVEDAFSVEKLNKEFFTKYKAHYEQFWHYIAENHREVFLPGIAIPEKLAEKEKQEKPIRDFAKKLLGRLVFLHFLQRKGWLGCPITNAPWEGGDQSFLLSLFERFPDKEHFHSQALAELFFRTLNNPNRENFRFQVGGMRQPCRVPYLNGGLFDNDEPTAAQLDFPVQYFAELLDFFSQYNFTIDENRPDDHEVGIDPEMLGHIFENLLEENREKGAFYTPREVVQYMCQESLIEYLSTHLVQMGVDQADISALVRQQKVEDRLRPHAVQVDKLLSDVTICDPAIGSGAFPMGMLQEIFTARRYLYPHLNTSAAFNPVAVKKHIIQHTIHGVDLDKGAVDIARLRFWLALVVDEEQPQPLPNLDFKIMQGNSLLESFEGIKLDHLQPTSKDIIVKSGQQIGLFQPLEDQQQQQQVVLESLLRDYFAVGDAPRKRQLRKQIDLLVHEHLHYNAELQLSKAREMLTTAELILAHNRFDDRDTSAQREKKTKALEKQLRLVEKCGDEVSRLEGVRQRLDDLQDSAERPYFLWHLYFHDIFQYGGFDVVIGNPPYVVIHSDVYKMYYEQHYNLQQGKPDLYRMFVELSLSLVRENGILSFIIPNTMLTIPSAFKLRKYISEQWSLLSIVNFNNMVFDEASVNSVICTFVNRVSDENIVNIYDVDTLKKPIIEQLKFSIDQTSMINSETKAWDVFSDSAINEVIQKIENSGLSLKDYGLSVSLGMQPYHNTIHSKEEIENRFLHSDVRLNHNYYGDYGGKSFGRYSSVSGNVKYVNFSGNLYTKPEWHFFSGKRLVVREIIGDTMIASLVDDDIVFNKSVYIVKDVSGEFPIERLLAIINSKVVSFWIKSKGDKSKQTLFPRVSMGALKRIPMPDIQSEGFERIDDLVENIIHYKLQGLETKNIENEVDVRIMILYGIKKEEANLIINTLGVCDDEKEKINTIWDSLMHK